MSKQTTCEHCSQISGGGRLKGCTCVISRHFKNRKDAEYYLACHLINETAVRKQITAYFRSLGAVVLIADRRPDSHNKGAPDLTICLNGKFIGIEVKRPKKAKISQAQPEKVEAIRAAGGIAGIVKSVEEAVKLVEGVK